MFAIGLHFALVCLLQLGFILLIFRRKDFLQSKGFPKSAYIALCLLLLLLIGVVYMILYSDLKQYHKPQPFTQRAYQVDGIYPTTSPQEVEKLGERKSDVITSYYFLYKLSDKSKQKVATIARQLRYQYCKNLCLINIYDDKKAYEIDMQRVSITSVEKMKLWNEKNYIFVADHYVGYLEAVDNAQFSYYPFHDSFYKKAVKAKQTQQK